MMRGPGSLPAEHGFPTKRHRWRLCLQATEYKLAVRTESIPASTQLRKNDIIRTIASINSHTYRRLSKVSRHQGTMIVYFQAPGVRDSSIRMAFHTTCQRTSRSRCSPLSPFVEIQRNQVLTPLRVLHTRVCMSLSTSEKD